LGIRRQGARRLGGSLEQALREGGAPAHVAVSGLSKRFGASTVLDRVDLSVAPGALVTLLGPSGCGKTTLLRLIAGLATPDEGTVSIAGVDMTRTPPHPRNVGVVFQNYALFPHLSVAGNVGFGLKGRGLTKDAIAAKIARSLDLVQMSRLRDRPVTALSGGQQQRVALARALAIEPKVLLFDEALSALDRNLRERKQGELRRLLKELGATAVFVTHDQDEALTMSDRIAVMNAGRIEQYSDPLSVYARPATLFAMRFVGVSSELAGIVVARSGGLVRVQTPIGVVLAHGDQAPGAAVVVATRPEHVKIEASSSAASEAGWNRVDGRIRQITFQGSRTRVAVDVGTSSDFAVEIGGLSRMAAAGESVRLSWPSEQSFAYLDPGAEP
jgi:putative spermidine/putrescine transport system ATP-binding protein